MKSHANEQNCAALLPIVRGVLSKAYGRAAGDEAAWITLKALEAFDPEKCDARHMQTYVCGKAKQVYLDHLRQVNGRRPENRPRMIGIGDDDAGVFVAHEDADDTTTIEEALHEKTPRLVRGAVIVSILLGTAYPSKVAKAMRCETSQAAALLAQARRRADD